MHLPASKGLIETVDSTAIMTVADTAIVHITGSCPPPGQATERLTTYEAQQTLTLRQSIRALVRVVYSYEYTQYSMLRNSSSSHVSPRRWRWR